MRRTQYLYSLVAGIALLGACATEPPPLDRTQPEAVPKSIFEGTWYYNLTVTDADYENTYTFIGEQTATYMDKAFKVRWEITKDKLNAHLVPQVYLSPKGEPIENPYGQKSVVLSFPIEKHYDIRYRYNSTTREELNVIEENTDRPWQQREYMEVDWTRNVATNMWNPTQMEISTNSLEREDVASYENVEFWARGADKDSDILIDTRKWRKDKDPEVYTINIDTKESFTTKLRHWLQLYYGYFMDPSTVRFRHSLMKVPTAEERTYQPLEYRDEFFRRFGYFRTEFDVRDPERLQATESQRKYMINRWDLSGEKQIVWYLSPSSQEMVNREKEQSGDGESSDLLAWSHEVVQAWNKALQIATGRGGQELMVLRENEPLLDDKGQQVTRADGSKRWKYELGDLRFPMINYVYKQQQSQPLGYGPSVPDNDSGEIVHAVVNVYAGWCDWVVRRALDQYDVAAGNCTLEDVKNGRYFDPIKKTCTAGDPLPPTNGPGTPLDTIPRTGGPGPNPAGTAKPTGAPAPSSLAELRFLSPALQTAYWPKADPAQPISQEFLKELASGAPKLKFKQLLDAQLKQRTMLDPRGFKTVAGSAYESQLLPSSTLVGAVPHGAGPHDPEVIAHLSPASRLSPEGLADAKQRVIKGMMLRDEPIMFEPAIHAFVDEMKGKKREDVVKILRRWIYYTTTLHEMGHTIGLRHNFKASVDERNFPPEFAKAKEEYWDKLDALRTQYGTKIRMGDSAAYEAYVKAVDAVPSTKDRYGSASIMEYTGDWMEWSTAARPYDLAALAFGYGQKVEVNQGGKWVFQKYLPGDFEQVDPLDPEQSAKSGRKVRYYLFCSDEKTFDDAFCTTFDRGTTATEITRNMIRDAQVNYFFSNFKRDRASFDGAKSGYYWRKWIYHYYMMAKPLCQLQINSMWYPEFWGSIWDGVNAVANGGPEKRTMKPGYYREGGEDLLRASLLAYYYLLYDVLMRPDYGYYSRKLDTSGARYWEETDARFLDEKAMNVFVDAGAGWGYTDRYDVQADPTRYYEHMQRLGVETDKMIAYEVLSIPAVLNQPLYYEKANGLSFWNSLWTNNGSQLWQVTRGLITDNFSHTDNPWCMKCDAACRADPQKNPPVLKAYPVDYLEGLARAGVFSSYPYLPKGKNRCGTDEEPLQPGMDALFAIKPIFYSISGASHPWYHNSLVEKLDSQVKGGLHRFDIPPEAVAAGKVAELTNPLGTKTYQAVQTTDNVSISYQIIDNARRIKNRVDLYTACKADGKYNGPLVGSVGTHDRTCSQVMACYPALAIIPKADYCEEEGWEAGFSLDMIKYRDVERAEAMLIMMQDMIDLAGHYQWRVPGYLGGAD